MNRHQICFEEVESGTLAVPQIAAGQIHFWAVRLNPAPTRVSDLAASLCASEAARSDRYQFERDRRRFRVRRGFLRSLLCRYLACPPEQLRFGSGPEGKPFLTQHPDLYFNLSHSGELALIAISCEAELGVDIEQMRFVDDADTIVRRLFSSREAAEYFATPVSARPAVFFNCWTRKEAFVKALGNGLSFPLRQFEVSVKPGEPARVLAIKDDPGVAAGWTLIHFEPAPGFVGALASRQAPLKISARIVDLDRTMCSGMDPAAG